MTVGATQFSSQQVTGLLTLAGFPISGALIPPGYVACAASTTDDKAIALPNSTSALLNGRAFYGVSAASDTSTSDDKSVACQRDGIVSAWLKTNTACTIDGPAAYDPADGGPVVPYTSQSQVLIGKFTQTKAAVSGGQFVGVELLPGASGAIGSGLLLFAAPQAGTASTVSETAYSNATLTLPANFLRVGDVIEFGAGLIVSNQNGTDTLQVRWKIGSTTIVQNVSSYDPATGDVMNVRGAIGVSVLGASGVLDAYGSVSYGIVSMAATTVAGVIAPTVDTTAAITLTLTAQWSASSASDLVDLKTAWYRISRQSA